MTTSTVPTLAPPTVTSWQRRAFAEFLGSALLATIVIGSGIAASALSPDDVGLQLLENAAATALGLYVLIVVLAPLSGAHFNPIVSLVDGVLGFRAWRDLASYLPAQFVGCTAGAVLANAMYGLPAITLSAKDRLTGPHLLAEVIATAGLVLVIFVLARSGRGQLAPAAVAAYIGSAYFFTSSTSFANPAITIGRMFTDTFAGIGPGSAPAYIGAQLVGGSLGLVLVRTLYPDRGPAPISHPNAVASTPL
ncbi:MIP/aquaporin family protein [Cryobacterium sp. MDB2-33-2]|uniref:aquaporin n=1 Tax=Cryobacterium sp. MDB2-33-2 TaxID=1259179 RepID=UPI001069EEBD|nr:MIP/aquaporin family protein [Cryobacterium sp. MDB2-33-2]TFC03335.1 aquaporin family protein [Cryobacterium sp. MDB2-33-2]